MRKRLTQILGTCVTLAIFAAIVLTHHPVEAPGAKTALLHDETVSKSIRLILANYATSLVGDDVDAFVALWDDQATWLPSDGSPVSGKRSIERTVRRTLGRDPVEGMSVYVRDINTEGHLAVAIGDFTQSTEATWGRNHSEGSFLAVFRKQPDGSWRIYQSSFNFDTAAGGDPSSRS